MSTILSVEGLVKRFRGVHASDGIDFDLRQGEIHAVIGPNGAGKTTFISQLAGEILPDAGRIVMDGVDITRAPVHRRAVLGLARSYQITAVFDELTVLENVMLAAQGRTGHCFQFIRTAANDARVTAAARHAIELVGLAAFADSPAADLSHGARRQLELAMAVSLRPRILLLDEPMAGTGSAESREMVELLGRLRSEAAIVLVEHDLEAVFALADRISVLVYGKVIATGAAHDIRSNALVREAYIGEGEEVV